MTDNVVTLPGVFRPEIEAETDAAEVLRAAADAGLRDVAVVGRNIAGEICVWASAADCDKAIGLFHRGLVFLADAEQVHFEEEKTNP